MTVKEALEKLIDIPVQVIPATVKDVDKAQATCDVEPLNGNAEMFDVRLRAVTDGNKTGMVLFPAVGSVVLVGLINNNVNSAFVAMCSEVDEIVINGGSFGGMVKAPELKTQLDKNNLILSTFLKLLKSPIPEPGNGSPSAFQAALNSALGSLQLGNFANIENEKIKH